MKTFYEAHVTKHEKPCIYHEFGSGFNTHWHENIEILHFSAPGSIICDRNKLNFDKGDFVIINSDVLHTIENRQDYFYECFIVDSEFCLENGIDVSRLDFDTCITDTELEKLYNLAIKELEQKNNFFEAGIKAAILNVMVYLCRNHSRRTPPRNKKDLNIKKAITYINEHFAEHLTVEQISSHAALSKYYFCREFKKVTGYSVIQYINITRCRAAEKMLTSKNYNVSEAAEAAGYGNLSYFTKTFKSITGYLPGEYKNNKR